MGKHSPQQNLILAALPVEAMNRLAPQLELVRLRLGDVVYESGDPLRYAYFPTDSIVSLLYAMENGSRGEIAVIGNEGIVGVSLFMGGQSTSNQAVVQSAGPAYRLLGSRLMEEFGRHGKMMELLLRYTQSLITQMTQTAACNRHHSIDEQMARWLLLSLDRLSGKKMVMTQQLIANMLSVSTARVTEVAGKLQSLRVIKYEQGRIEVLDRPTLEKLCCECYDVVRGETDRLFAQSPVRVRGVSSKAVEPRKRKRARRS